MNNNTKVRPRVEQLEDRWVPTTVKLFDGTLLISNPTLGSNNIAAVTVKATATGLSISTAGGSTVNVGAVGNIIYSGSLGKDNFTFDANGQTYHGNLFVNANNGNDSITVGDSVGGGAIGGNITLLTGNGTDSVDMGTLAGAVNILGNVEVVSTTGKSALTVGGPAVTNILGNFSATGRFTSVTLSPTSADSYSGYVAINNLLTAGSPPVTIGNATNAISIAGNLTINANGANDSVTLQGTNAAPLNIGGITTLNLGGGDSQVTSDSVTFSGAFNLNAGEGNNAVTVTNGGTTFLGNAAINYGDGDNSFNLGNTFTALGNFQISAGNGDNVFEDALPLSTFAGDINGNLGIFLGNGANSLFDLTGSVGGKVFWRSGNGDNFFVLGDGTTTNNYNVNALFGNGDDSFALDVNNANILTGIVDGSGGTNTFLQISGQLAPTFQLINF